MKNIAAAVVFAVSAASSDSFSDVFFVFFAAKKQEGRLLNCDFRFTFTEEGMLTGCAANQPIALATPKHTLNLV